MRRATLAVGVAALVAVGCSGGPDDTYVARICDWGDDVRAQVEAGGVDSLAGDAGRGLWRQGNELLDEAGDSAPEDAGQYAAWDDAVVITSALAYEFDRAPAHLLKPEDVPRLLGQLETTCATYNR